MISPLIDNASMTKFRPCIDLHEGSVKQIVGGSLRDSGDDLVENFVSEKPAAHFAQLYAADELCGGHVIKLGAGNDVAALAALSAYPRGLQIGGGITIENAADWLDAGASHVIVTSWLFDKSGQFQRTRLEQLSREIGPQRLVIDLSCRRDGDGWVVAMNRWQTRTNLVIDSVSLDSLADFADEFLIHAADVEGLCGGIDEELVQLMGTWGGLPMTYAGGASSINDLQLVSDLSNGAVDLTIGSALDIFGGSRVRYADAVAWNRNFPPT
jgi:phosphoribosylformimino-5-aminoimidazole carboxamide ribotide isomerase